RPTTCRHRAARRGGPGWASVERAPRQPRAGSPTGVVPRTWAGDRFDRGSPGPRLRGGSDVGAEISGLRPSEASSREEHEARASTATKERVPAPRGVTAASKHNAICYTPGE